VSAALATLREPVAVINAAADIATQTTATSSDVPTPAIPVPITSFLLDQPSVVADATVTLTDTPTDTSDVVRAPSAAAAAVAPDNCRLLWDADITFAIHLEPVPDAEATTDVN